MNDDEITQLYKKIYFEKPALIEKLNGLQEQIQSSQQVALLSSTFDYNLLLLKYDINSIDSSNIQRSYNSPMHQGLDAQVGMKVHLGHYG